MLTLEISIPIASEWPTREDLNSRNAIEDALNAAGIGIVSGAGGGMGMMDLAYRVDDAAKITAARALIDQAMKTHMANFQYEITVC
jgi:hypothetical protein